MARWLDRHGRLLPLEDVFAEQLVEVRLRAERQLARLLEARRHRRTPEPTADVLIVRTAHGERQHRHVVPFSTQKGTAE